MRPTREAVLCSKTSPRIWAVKRVRSPHGPRRQAGSCCSLYLPAWERKTSRHGGRSASCLYVTLRSAAADHIPVQYSYLPHAMGGESNPSIHRTPARPTQQWTEHPPRDHSVPGVTKPVLTTERALQLQPTGGQAQRPFLVSHHLSGVKRAWHSLILSW